MRDDVFGSIPRLACEAWAKRSALRYGADDYSFEDIDRLVDQAGRGLLHLGVEKGDRVALFITNRPEFVIALYAVLKIGAIAVPLNTRYREIDLAYALRFAECKILVGLDQSGPVDYLALIANVLTDPIEQNGRLNIATFPSLERVIVIGDRQLAWSTPWSDLLKAADSIDPNLLARRADTVDPADTCLIVYTSGTTGHPKGVMHNHAALQSCRERAQYWNIQPGSVTLNYLPMFHLYGLSEIVVGAMISGVRQIVMDGFDADQSLDLIEQHRVDIIHGFDTHYIDLLRALAARPRDVSSLRFGTFPSGLESSIAVAREVQARLCPTVTGIGMSETWAWIAVSTLADTPEQRCETSGKPMNGIEIRIADPKSGASVADGQPGEILYRGYTLMQGYFRDPDATSKSFDAEGWFHSGDQGIRRPDGFVQFQGRYKEMLRVGGENVSAAGVETELMALEPDIEQVAVVPYPDTRLGEVVVAYIVQKPNRTLTEDGIRTVCKGQIASFKIPRHVIIVEELPTTASGKVQRTLLRERALADLKAHENS
jgi:fatty-acyl-CoA synthase